MKRREHPEDMAAEELILLKEFQRAARTRHSKNNLYRGRPKDPDSGEHHMPLTSRDLYGTDGALPIHRNSPRGR